MKPATFVVSKRETDDRKRRRCTRMELCQQRPVLRLCGCPVRELWHLGPDLVSGGRCLRSSYQQIGDGGEAGDHGGLKEKVGTEGAALS